MDIFDYSGEIFLFALIFGLLAAIATRVKASGKIEDMLDQRWEDQRADEWRTIRKNWSDFPFVIKAIFKKVFYPPKGAAEYEQFYVNCAELQDEDDVV